jgi:hypothetical protein
MSQPPSFDTELLRRLRELPVEPPSLSFAAHAVRVRRSFLPHLTVTLALAASLALAIGPRAWFDTSDSPAPPSNEPRVVLLTPGQVQPVSLVFRSERAMTGVIIELQIPDGVELAGRTGRQWRWIADLQAGANQLDLPLTVRGGVSAVLVATLSHGPDRKQFSVRVKAREGLGT